MSVDPASLSIRLYPDPVLREEARGLPAVTGEVREVAARMLELMHEARGIGLAAPQVGLPWAMFVLHVPEAAAGDADPDAEPSPEGVSTFTDRPLVFINPRLSDFSRDLVPWDEGCLSLPDINGHVRRPSQVSVTATDLAGKEFTLRTAGLLARCIQHEHDHLQGVLIIDRFTQVSKVKNRAAVRELERGARTL